MAAYPPITLWEPATSARKIEIKTLADGDRILYVATTATDEVYSFNLGSNNASLFVSTSTLDQATGLPVDGVFNDPGNMAIDAEGNYTSLKINRMVKPAFGSPRMPIMTA